MNFINKTIFIFVVMIFSTYSIAAQVNVNQDFIDDVNKLSIKRITSKPYLGYVKNTAYNFRILDKYGFVDRKNNGRISLSYNTTYNGQCASLIQTTSNAGSVSGWKKGPNVSPLTPKFTPLATFYGDGNSGQNTEYDNDSENSHVVYFISYTNEGILVLDQNHKGTGVNPIGELAIRIIPFSGNHQFNADNYYVITK